MKNISLSLLVIVASCTTITSTTLPVPADSIILPIIQEIYTADNKMDGAEFASVDSVLINEKIMNAAENSCLIKFHINCSYQPAVMPPGFERNRPPLNTDTTIVLTFKNKHWEISNE